MKIASRNGQIKESTRMTQMRMKDQKQNHHVLLNSDIPRNNHRPSLESLPLEYLQL